MGISCPHATARLTALFLLLFPRKAGLGERPVGRGRGRAEGGRGGSRRLSLQPGGLVPMEPEPHSSSAEPGAGREGAQKEKAEGGLTRWEGKPITKVNGRRGGLLGGAQLTFPGRAKPDSGAWRPGPHLVCGAGRREPRGFWESVGWAVLSLRKGGKRVAWEAGGFCVQEGTFCRGDRDSGELSPNHPPAQGLPEEVSQDPNQATLSSLAPALPSLPLPSCLRWVHCCVAPFFPSPQPCQPPSPLSRKEAAGRCSRL